jgi:hypothetical protein
MKHRQLGTIANPCKYERALGLVGRNRPNLLIGEVLIRMLLVRVRATLLKELLVGFGFQMFLAEWAISGSHSMILSLSLLRLNRR